MMTLKRRSANRITKTKKNNGETTYEEDEIQMKFVSYFESILNTNTQPSSKDIDNIMEVIPCLIDTNQQKELNKEVTQEEIKNVVSMMNDYKSPGPNGFPAGFFKHNWDIVGKDVSEAVLEFFKKGYLLKEWNATFVALIPKSESAKEPKDYRPISLCNVIYKILTKIMVERIKPILPRLILDEQDGFVKGKHITNGIVLMHKVLHSVHIKKEESMFLKLDMEKAYDRVNQEFLMEVLRRFKFGEKFRNQIHQCISTPKFSIIFNGVSKGFFSTNRGLQQGAPISPYLFILMVEVLGRSLRKAKEEGHIIGLKLARDSDCYTHHQFVDDTILMGKVDKKEARKLNDILSHYEETSIQKINLQKIKLFVLHSSQVKRRKLANIFGCQSSELPSVYLKMLFFEGRIKASYWKNLINKIQRKLVGWKNQMLSYVGQLSLIEHTLLSILIYLVLVFKILVSIAKRIDRLCREFLLSGEDGRKKVSLLARKTICRDRKDGGLGISSSSVMSEALRDKMAWQLVTEEGKQWIEICKRKYLQKENSFLRTKNLPYRSSFWNVLVQVQRNINRYITWQVGNGKNTYFWEDTWLREQPLIEYDELKKIAKWAIRKQGAKIANYLDKDGKEWIFKEVEIQHVKDQLQRVKEELREK